MAVLRVCVEPQSEYETKYGKAVLLTDCEIAIILEALKVYEPQTLDGEEACDRLWCKLVPLFQEEQINVPVLSEEPIR